MARVRVICCFFVSLYESRQKRKTRWIENKGSILSKNARVDTFTYAQKGHRIGCFCGGTSVGVFFFTFVIAWGWSCSLERDRFGGDGGRRNGEG